MQVMMTRPATDAERKTAANRMGKCKSLLLLDQPFFGSLALRLGVVEVDDPGILMATDGTHLYYNPREVLGLTDKNVQAIIAHEVLHCALGHVWREGSREHGRWNVACDHVVNLHLEEAGFAFPADGPWQGLKNPVYRGLASEEVYARLPEDGNGPGDDGDGTGPRGQPPPGYRPDMTKPKDLPGKGTSPGAEPTEAPRMTETDWRIAAEQAAMVARKAGRLPGGMDRMIRESREPRADWRAILREFVEHTLPSDYSWTTPNRRHVADGLYFPGVFKENTARLVVAIDTSGSVSQPMLDQMAGELTSILVDCRPEELLVIYCDARVQGEPRVFTPDDGLVELQMRGGGGTAFTPVFAWIDENLPEPPACLIYLTDLESSDTPTDPGYPVLWGATMTSRKEGPFGRTVKIDVDGGE